MGLVEDDIGVVERAPAHKREGGNFDDAGFHEKIELVHGQHVVQGVVQRSEVRIYLFFQVARQEAQVLTGFYGRTGQHDFFDQFVFQGAHSDGHGGIGFTGTRRAEGENDKLRAKWLPQINALLMSLMLVPVLVANCDNARL